MRAALVIAVAALTLGGCGSPGWPYAYRDDGIDHSRIGVIEDTAKSRNLRILWINPPRRTAPLPVVPVTGEDRA